VTIQSQIFHQLSFKQATEHPHTTRLFGRPTTDPKKQEEADYLLEHGMTREQTAERDRMIARERFEDGVLTDLKGEPPEDICNTRGLSQKRARYALFFELRLRLAKELSNLETKKADFQALIEAPEATEGEIRREVIRSAAHLLGRNADNSGSAKRKALEDRLAAERHSAEAAQEATPELDHAIEKARLRLAHINSREDEFLIPAVIEVANESGLGELYLKKVDELRAVLDLINGLANVARRQDYWSGFSGLEGAAGQGTAFAQLTTVKLPCPAMEAVKKAEAKLVLSHSGNTDVWKQLMQSLLLDPRHNAKNFIALPK